ncbi:L-fucokinase [Trinorchestia longiramus]|nr:L-fucokinase [Trinorchestia longiramus]
MELPRTMESDHCLNSSSVSSSVVNFMRANFNDYKLLLCSSPSVKADRVPFWDCVVLTAYDSCQQRGIEQQLKLFRDNGRVPKSADIRVIADPDTCKLGCGGSTLHCLRELQRAKGDAWLRSSKVLIIHSGGSSQRLPSYSAQGKIFAPMPVAGLTVGGEVPLMLDVKLALYLPLCRLLHSGVLIVGSDHIETYCLPQHFPSSSEAEQLASSDVVALAHPSSLAIGEGHGVYVLQPRRAPGPSVRVESVLEVLQKPSRALMKEKGAIVSRAATSDEAAQEMVYSDSVFWLSYRLYDSLLSWYTDHTPLQEEFDAYAHLLPAFGDNVQSNSENNLRSDHCHEKTDSIVNERPSSACPKNLDKSEIGKISEEHPFLSQMKVIMRSRSLKVIVLESSKFHHLGSMREYVDNLTNTMSLREGLGLENIVRCSPEKAWNDTNHSSVAKNTVVVMECCFGPSGKLDFESGIHAVIEWSYIDVPVVLDDDILISNCTIRSDSSVTFKQPSIKLFKGVCMHTVPIKDDNTVMYVTCALSIDDDIKASSHDLSRLSYFGIDVITVLKGLGYKAEDIFGSEKKFSLWNMRLFPKAESPCVSFWMCYTMINRLLNDAEGCPLYANTYIQSDRLYSLKDLAALKDLDALLRDRKELEEKLSASD